MRRNILISAALITSAALLFAADVKTDYSHSVDFGQYHTYSWLKVDAGNPLWIDRIKRDVDAELSPAATPRFPHFGATHNQQTLQTFYDGFGGGWFWGGFGGPDLSTTTTVNTPVGTLVVDIFDAHTKKLIWRGTSDKTLSEKPDKNEKKLEDSVQSMFKHFPPAPKS
jgi:hypothetical protein